MRRPVVAVFGGGDPADETRELAEQAGAGIAARGWHLLTGGGPGVMQAAALGFTLTSPRAGLALGILPGPEARPGYPNEFTELAIFTPLSSDPQDPLNRNWANARTSWGALVLPGGAGTAQELALCRVLGTPARTVSQASELAEALRWLEANLSDPATR